MADLSKWEETLRKNGYTNQDIVKITMSILKTAELATSTYQDEIWDQLAQEWKDLTDHEMRARSSSFKKIKSKFIVSHKS